jgi:hypothetical protein
MQEHKCTVGKFGKRRQVKDLCLVVISENPAILLETIFDAPLF